jgi:hypothetical protein
LNFNLCQSYYLILFELNSRLSFHLEHQIEDIGNKISNKNFYFVDEWMILLYTNLLKIEDLTLKLMRGACFY